MNTKPTHGFTHIFPLVLAHLFLASVPLRGQPVIPSNQPADQTAIAGATAAFSVAATGVPPLIYQWRRYTNGTAYGNIPGETNDVLALTNVQPTTHRFAVVVSDSTGSSTSRLAKLTVNFPPRITIQPLSQFAEAGDTVTFAVGVTGTTPLTYQWRLNDTNLPGKTSTNLVLANVQLTNAGGYTVVVTNIAGATNSQVATDRKSVV